MAETLCGEIVRTTFTSEETGFTIAKVRVKGQGEVTVVGPLMGPPDGTFIEALGRFESHSQYGLQFKVEKFSSALPVTSEGIKRYLSSKAIHGIGPKMAERLVGVFGNKTLEVIDKQPERLLDVEGIGKKKAEQILTGWEEQMDVRQVMVFLHSHGVGNAFASRIVKAFGKKAVSVVTRNPYALATEVAGIGFLTADRIARSTGFAQDAPQRIHAGLLYALSQATDEGHLFLPIELLIQKSVELLQLSHEPIRDGIAFLVQNEKVITKTVDDPQIIEAVYLPWLFHSERGIAVTLSQVAAGAKFPVFEDAQRDVAAMEKRLSITLAPMQREAVQRALTSKAMVITGGPGTGKTTIIKAILKIYHQAGARMLLAAPTGRAAKRMTESTGFPAKTIHRLLEFSFQKGGFQRNRENPLSCDVLVVDEASMIDVPLMFNLLKAVPDTATLILVGDVHQLPPVGPGNVLRDVIASRRIPVTTLTEIFRQAEKSLIVVNAHRINQGERPFSGSKEPGGDFFIIERNDPEAVASTIVELVARRIPRRFNLNPMEDIQLLTPMHKGSLGGERLNQLLQDTLNPKPQGAPEETVFKFRFGDKVMQLKNNYDKDVFNGDIGRIVAADPAAKRVIVRFEENDVTYEAAELDELTLAYAVSIHKSQGSEYPAVVIPVSTQHQIMLQRNLIYTGITRGKELVVLVGSYKALAIAVKNNKTIQRFTRLTDLLQLGK
ncbi:ATP-dependent RecD-like DNA helicase [Desulfoluna limicola]|uniref:ATP-dependent RecD-like DNA helicase n=1 Tax=Desulfoluna limicola TaxID=2810562 RepID=A0ABN6F6V9_9BACT|nr:ATP-dependent RecD-like DNA helicase [Desulfoluna limicola]BCS98078.1 ATP-dependent RecD-like DNA helicase [Desulfoluna limicola]